MKVFKKKQKLRMMILESGRSEAEIAKKVGFTRQHLNYVLKNAVKLSTLERLEEKLKEALD